MHILKIYKVRFLDIAGHEVAEFGFYENRSDAMRRWEEIRNKISMPGSLDIREITVIPDSERTKQKVGEDAQYYELRENNNEKIQID